MSSSPTERTFENCKQPAYSLSFEVKSRVKVEGAFLDGVEERMSGVKLPACCLEVPLLV